MIGVLVADEDWLIRMGLKNLLGADPRFAHLGEARTAAGAIEIAKKSTPDVVIMDVRLPDCSGIEACRQIRSVSPSSRVIMLSACSDEHDVVEALLAGASAYLLKQTEPERLIAAVETVASGGSVLDATVSDTFLRWMRSVANSSRRSHDGLSEHERKILPLIAQGKTNRQIAAELYLSEHTIKTYVSGLFKKLQLARRSEAAAYVARHEHAAA